MNIEPVGELFTRRRLGMARQPFEQKPQRALPAERALFHHKTLARALLEK